MIKLTIEDTFLIHDDYYKLGRDKKREVLTILKTWVEDELEANERCKLKYLHDFDDMPCERCRAK